MKTFEKQMKQGIQGDVAFTRIDEGDLPEGLQSATPEKLTGQLVVAHSETGHNHSFSARLGDVDLLEDPDDELVAYLRVNKTSDLVHHRSHDTHETVRFTPGLYKVNRQREHVPEMWDKNSEAYQRVHD